MARYDRHYDYGLRGYDQTVRQHRDAGPRGMGHGYDYGYRGAFPIRRPNRVTERYNRDYTYDRPYRGTRRNYASFGGDFDGRIVDSSEYLHPYMTIGGSRTSRGSVRPPHERPVDPLQDRLPPGYDRDYSPGGWW